VLVDFVLLSKRQIQTGRFSRTFAEITDEMSSENGFRWSEGCFQTTIYTLSKENQGEFPLFFILFAI